MFTGKNQIDQALSALGDQLAAKIAPPVDMLICGGAALNLLNLVGRTTVDVDVLAFIVHEDSRKLRAKTAKPFPPFLEEAVAKVARDFGLPSKWLNSGPTSALELGLPDGLLERMETRSYGTALTVRLLSRYDQIHFKLYAAVDRSGKHYDDLLALKPTPSELEAAARWSMTHDVSEAYKGELQKMLTAMGHPDVARQL
ncbi:MAG: hypothetical protein HYZ73_06695 [Elusimicrobia bacterium]|nr:hypothetical protein [Elusimicrobiota bacterium]